MGFILTRGNTVDGIVEVYSHDGINITPLGALPGAGQETEALGNGYHSGTRGLVVLDKIFVWQDGAIYKSTDEEVTFASEFVVASKPTNAGSVAQGWNRPVPVMVSGALKYIGFYVATAGSIVHMLIYDVATDAWSDLTTGVVGGGGCSSPVSHDGKIYFMHNQANATVFDPVSSSATTLGFTGGTLTPAGSMIVWNNNVYLIGRNGAGAVVHWFLAGASFTAGPSTGAQGATGSIHAVFADPNTNDLIVVAAFTGANTTRITSMTPGHVVTDLTGTVGSAALNAISVTGTAWFFPVVTRGLGGGITVDFYGMSARTPAGSVQKFTWVNQGTLITAGPVVGGAGSWNWPVANDGADHWLFNANQKRIAQVAQATLGTGLRPTFKAYASGGGTVSVTPYWRSLANGADVKESPVQSMTISNPLGAGGLGLSGANPGKVITGVPTDKTAITFDWDQITDGFVGGDDYDFQLEVS